MDFARLRLSGFKSFVDAAEVRIEPGLTGVVGPNGCGKSNLLEALRWVMGAASAKAMRGEGMDDVIFAGSGKRPARNHAEVTLTIDNPAADAPAAFRAEPVLEVTRRIDRGEGSTYRVNGREVRARDVQILFADASTGANSPALVRQGQISELIAAKPQNRRRILEEAAGVTGLHGRRHEAELRVAAAGANLDRLSDLARELETSLSRLKREARQAARYKALAAEIRTLSGALLQQRWGEARAAVERALVQAKAAHAELETSAREAAACRTASLAADAALAPLREAEAGAAAVLGRLTIERDRLDRQRAEAEAEAARLTSALTRLAEDDGREDERQSDAAAALARLATEAEDLRAALDAAPERLPALQALAEEAEAARAGAEAAVETAASHLAAAEARARAGRDRVAEAATRAERATRALESARAEASALAGAADPGPLAAEAERLGVELADARAARERAEAARAEAEAIEFGERKAMRATEDSLAAATAEARALARLSATPVDQPFAAVLDSVRPGPGLEAALAAALGDELEAALDARALAHWAGATPPSPPAWPKGATPLADHVEIPPQLAARLALTALADAKDGARLQKALPPGARLVSREGDLWRWDGYTRRAGAPSPARVRLEQKARLAALETAIADQTPIAEAARAVHAGAVAAIEKAGDELGRARAAATAAEVAQAKAREAAETAAREAARREARAALLAQALERAQSESAEAAAVLSTRQAEVEASRVDASLAGDLETARAVAVAARAAAAEAILACESERREREGRARRLVALETERADWERRGAAAVERRASLAEEQTRAKAALDEARGAPERSRNRREALMKDLGAAEGRKATASDAVAAGETARTEAEAAARRADGSAADAREARAGLDARLEAARERLAEHAAALAEASGLTAAELEARFGAQAAANDLEPGTAEARLATLERERDMMGPVNLRAEEEASELAARVAGLAADRADLNQALAKLRQAIGELNAEGRERLLAAFEVIHGHFRDLFVSLFQGGQAELRLVESEDPLEAGLEILACPPGKRMAVMSLMSGGEQALTAMALIFAVFLANPAPVCVLDEADAPLDDANVERFCNLLAAMRARASTRFIVITHNPLTMSRMDRLYGVTMREPGVSQLVSVDLTQAEAIAAQ